MSSPTNTLTARRAAVIAGIGYLAIFVLAMFANFMVRNGLVDTGDATATFNNIAESQSLFRLGTVAFLFVFMIDVVVAWALYVLFRPVNREVSLLAAWFRLVYTVMLGVSLIFFMVAARIISGSDYLAGVSVQGADIPVMLLLDAFNYSWLIGLACFGVHLMLLAYLVITSGAASKALGVLLGIAGVAYVIDTLANTLLGNYSDYASGFLLMVAIPSIIGELWFTIWLLVKAGKRPVGTDAQEFADEAVGV
ncbi:MAG: DUF4386 domain-containing protein [Candidatus Nanopelagicales bacterium]